MVHAERAKATVLRVASSDQAHGARLGGTNSSLVSPPAALGWGCDQVFKRLGKMQIF